MSSVATTKNTKFDNLPFGIFLEKLRELADENQFQFTDFDFGMVRFVGDK